MERDKLKRSDEEEDTLAHYTKKFKESHRPTEANGNGVGIKMGSYKDKLEGAIPGLLHKLLGLVV